MLEVWSHFRGFANQKRYDQTGKVCTGDFDSVAFKSLLELESDSFPAHWVDSKHESQGTAHEFLVTEAAVEDEEL